MLLFVGQEKGIWRSSIFHFGYMNGVTLRHPSGDITRQLGPRAWIRESVFTAATLEKVTKWMTKTRRERNSGDTRRNQQQTLRGVVACEEGADQESMVSSVQDSVLRRKWLWDPVSLTGQWHEY